MRVRVLQHVPFEGPAALAPVLRDAGHELAVSRLDAGDPLPALADFDWLVVLGGPMSVHDEAEHAWLAPEKRLVRAAVEGGRRVLGVCLGAQLIAASLGAAVTRNPEREIGWFPVERAPGAERSPLGRALPARFPAFHWHGETFAPPPGALRLAASEACAEQAFAIGERVLGLQFHVETTPEAAKALVEHCADELAPARWVQDASAILAADAPFAQAQAVMRALLVALGGPRPA